MQHDDDLYDYPFFTAFLNASNILRRKKGWSLLLCYVENMAVTVVQQNDVRLTEQEGKKCAVCGNTAPL
jgi:hypothetical protein